MKATNSVGTKADRFKHYVPNVFSNVARWEEHYYRPPVKSRAVPGTFHILDLPRPFVTPPNLRLPPADSQGFPHGEDYSALLKARSPSMATRTTLPGLKFHRRFEALSLGELRILLALWFSPYCVDLREQHAWFSVDALNDAAARGFTLARSQLMTIDVIATYWCPTDRRLKNHAISVKPASYRRTGEDIEREEREQATVGRVGWTWELLRSDAVTNTEYGNYAFLWSLVRHQNVPSLYAESGEFAKLLSKVSDRGTLRDMLARAANRAGMTSDRAARLLAVGAGYGFLTPDYRAPIRIDEPFYLIR